MRAAFKVFIMSIMFSWFSELAAVELTGETSNPIFNMFVKGEPAMLRLSASKLPSQSLSLHVKITDMNEKIVSERTVALQGRDGDNWTTCIPLATEKMGFFRVRIKLSDGTTVKKQGSRPAGFITYAVVVSPETRIRYAMNESFFGLAGTADKDSGTMAFMPYLGASWNILNGLLCGHHSAWRMSEPNMPGEFQDGLNRGRQFDFGVPPVRFSAGSKPWLLFSIYNIGVPKWSNINLDPYFKYDPTINDNKRLIPAPFSLQGEKEFVRFVEAFCREASTRVQPGQNNYYQVTWEPHYPWNFQGSFDDIVRIHQLAYDVIHKNDPSGFLIGPTAAGISKGYVDWHESLFKRGLGKYIDGLSIHPYFSKSNAREVDNVIENVRRLKAIARQYCGREIPFYGTECGFPTHDRVEKERDQALFTVRSNLIYLGEGFKFNISFLAVDCPGDEGFGILYNLDNLKEKPWTPVHVAPKPAAPAYAAMTSILEGHVTAGQVDSPDGRLMGYIYQRDAHVVLALWSSCAGTSAEIITGTDSIEISDMMGNRSILQTTQGKVKVALTEEPMYLIGVSPQLWGSLANRFIALTANNIKVVPGGLFKITGVITASTDFNGVLKLDGADKLGIETRPVPLVLKQGQSIPFEFNGKLSSQAVPGTFGVKIVSEVNGEPTAQRFVTLNIEPKIKIESLTQLVVNGKFLLEYKILNLTDEFFTGNIEIGVSAHSDNRIEAALRLSPGQLETIVVPFDRIKFKALKLYEIESRIVSNGNQLCKRVDSINFWKASAWNDLFGWDKIENHLLIGREYLKQDGGYRGADDLKANVSAAWTSDVLLLRFQVDDDIFMQPYTGMKTWDGDSIQIAVAKTGLESSTNLLAEKMERCYCEYDLALTAKGPELYRSVTYDEVNYPVGLVAPKQFSFDIKMQTLENKRCRLTYEIRIPWKSLNFVPRQGAKIGVAFTVNDRDYGQNVQRNASRLGAFELKIPSRFGTLVLE